MPSNQKKFIYDVKRILTGHSIQNAIVNFWAEVSISYLPLDQCLVFCQALNDAKVFGTALNVPCLNFHHDCLDSTPVDQWCTGTIKYYQQPSSWAVAFTIITSMTLFIWTPVLDQCQEDSRDGCDGLSSHYFCS